MLMIRISIITIGIVVSAASANDADAILHNGKIVTVDKKCNVHQAIAIRGDNILQVGSDADIMKCRGADTKVTDLQGKTVLPGLIDSHVHPNDACMTEFSHSIPEMETIADVLSYVRSRAKVLSPGE